MADHTMRGAGGDQKEIINESLAANGGVVNKTVRFANPTDKFSVYVSKSADVTGEVFAVTTAGDVSLGTIASGASVFHNTAGRVAGEIKVRFTNGDALNAEPVKAALVSA